MSNLTKNFSLREFRCKDGTDVPDDLMDNVQLLADNLQVLREELDCPVRIISGYRSPAYNKRCGGVKRSQHLRAKAADIRVTGLTPRQVHTVVLQLIREGRLHKGGVGLYTSFVHYDVRGSNARWRGRGVKDDIT